MPVSVADKFGNTVTANLVRESSPTLTLAVNDGGSLSVVATAPSPFKIATTTIAGSAEVSMQRALLMRREASADGVGSTSLQREALRGRSLSADGVGSTSLQREALRGRSLSADGVGAISAESAATKSRQVTSDGISSVTAIPAKRVARLLSSTGLATVVMAGFVSQSPKLDLNFASGTYADNASNTTLSSIVTFARSSSATYVDSSGVVQTAASGTIRDAHHEWNGSSWVRKGLLLETDAATNLIANSEDMTTWSQFASGSLTITSNSATGPDGLTSLDKIAITDTTSEAHGLFQSLTVTSGAAYTLSAFVSNGDQRYIGLRNYRASGAWSAVIFDLQTGTSTQQTSGSSGTLNDYGIIDYGSGLYRVWISSTETGTTLSPYIMTVSSGTPTLNSGDGTEVYAGTTGLFFNCGFTQVEAGSFPSSYIPTSGATATRAGETLSVNAAGVPWSTTAMSFVMEAEVSYTDNNATSEVQFFGNYVSASQALRVRLGTNSTNIGLLNALVENSGTVESASGSTQTTPAYRSTQKVGMRITTTDLQVVHNGTSGTNETAVGGVIDDFSARALGIGLVEGLAIPGFNGTISRLRMWDSDIGASQLETETT